MKLGKRILIGLVFFFMSVSILYAQVGIFPQRRNGFMTMKHPSPPLHPPTHHATPSPKPTPIHK